MLFSITLGQSFVVSVSRHGGSVIMGCEYPITRNAILVSGTWFSIFNMYRFLLRSITTVAKRADGICKRILKGWGKTRQI